MHDRRSGLRWWPVLATACLVLLGGLGCAASVSLAAAPSVDTKGQFGTEERLQASSAAGNQNLRFLVALSAGAGYLGTPRSGAATVSPEVGVEGGEAVQWSATAFYAPRFLFTGPLDVAQAGGTAAQVLFKVRRMGGEDGSLLLGPRIVAEVMDLDPSLPNGKGTVGLFQLALVLRWVVFDTTLKNLGWTN